MVGVEGCVCEKECERGCKRGCSKACTRVHEN